MGKLSGTGGEPVPNEMREFAREARDFLDAHAAGREEDAQFR